MKAVSCSGGPARGYRSALLALILATSTLLLGTSLQPKSLEELVREADLIIRGTVQAVRPGPKGKGDPTTIVSVSVQQQWKGGQIATLRLVLPRGTERGITRDVPGLPTFRTGEDVILFVVRESRGQYQILGGKQGKFSIHTDQQSGREVIQDLTGTRSDLSEFLSRISRIK